MKEEISWREYWDLLHHPRDIGKPEYRHLLLLLYWPLELAFFTVSGRIPWEYHPIHCALDDKIPFLEGFVIPYELWFLCGVFIVFFTLLYDVPSFRKFMWFMIVNILIAGAVFMIYPSTFLGRPVQEAVGWPASIADNYAAMPRKNLFTWMLSFIYFTDPPRNVFPSEHVAVALGMVAAVLHSKKLRSRRLFAVLFILLQLAVCASVCFTKQHSFLDVIGALPVVLISYLAAYVPWKKLRRRKSAVRAEGGTSA